MTKLLWARSEGSRLAHAWEPYMDGAHRLWRALCDPGKRLTRSTWRDGKGRCAKCEHQSVER